MKVILLQDVEKLGRKNDIKETADGFARNFLFPKKLAKPASADAIKQAELEKEAIAKKEEEDLVATGAVVSQLDGQEIEIFAKADESGKLYGSITAAKIAKALSDKGFIVKRKHVKLDEPIKETGDYEVALELDHGLEAKIKVIVSEELGEKMAESADEVL